MICENCLKSDETVNEIICPYAQDIHNEIVVLAVLCDECFAKDYDLQRDLHERAMDI